jgi:hypothetical protein
VAILHSQRPFNFLQTETGYIMGDLNDLLEPGMRVRHPTLAEWGIGQVQSNIGGRITVNFPEAGKVVIEGSQIDLIPVFDQSGR